MTLLFEYFPGVLVVWATVFNAVLAVVDAHALPVSSGTVIAAEVGTVAMAHVLASIQFRPEMRVWYSLIAVIVILFLLRSLLTGEPQAVYLRDVLLIPTFIVLGMSSRQKNLTSVVCVIHAIVLAVMAYEAIDTQGYAKLFQIQQYYIDTRGYDHDNFWIEEPALFVSANRWQDRFLLPFLPLHRLSSIFLEPVSLGNYVVVITIYLSSRFWHLTTAERWFLGLGNLAALIGCDGRFAGLSSVAIILASLVVTKLPRWSALLYLPGVTLTVIGIVAIAGFREGTDDLQGRIAYTVSLLSHYDLVEFIGISLRFRTEAVDSGIAYLILSQSLVGMSLVWCLIVFGARSDRPDQIRYTHGTCIYLALAMMVSSSIFTIKTAALLWFVQGALQRQERKQRVVLRPASEALREEDSSAFS